MKESRTATAAILLALSVVAEALQRPLGCCQSRRAALASGAAAATTTIGARPAHARKPPQPIPVTDRNGVQVTEKKWLANSSPQERANLVLGLDGEPYFLLTEPLPDQQSRLLPYALKAECTHLGCLVNPEAGGIGPLAFECPCHGSRYDAAGSVTRGPAPRALGLAKVEAREEDGVLIMSPWTGKDPRVEQQTLAVAHSAEQQQMLSMAQPAMPRSPRPTPSRTGPIVASASSPSAGRVALSVDLGADGEPSGVSRLIFAPRLARSEFVQLNISVPLGLRIIETDDGDILIEGALPGYGADGQVEPGDLVRAVTAYRQVVSGAPMWQQVISYTPVGEIKTKRLIFRTEGATYADVRDAIASHRQEEGGNGMVTLVVERARDEGTPPTQPRDAEPIGLEPLGDVIKRDLQKKAVKDELTEAVERPSASERAKRLLDLGFDVNEDDLT